MRDKLNTAIKIEYVSGYSLETLLALFLSGYTLKPSDDFTAVKDAYLTARLRDAEKMIERNSRASKCIHNYGIYGDLCDINREMCTTRFGMGCEKLEEIER